MEILSLSTFLILNICAVIVIARVPVIIANTLLIYITWRRLSTRDTFIKIRLSCRGSSTRLSLAEILFRDGVYLMVMMRCMVANNGTMGKLEGTIHFV